MNVSMCQCVGVVSVCDVYMCGLHVVCVHVVLVGVFCAIFECICGICVNVYVWYIYMCL